MGFIQHAASAITTTDEDGVSVTYSRQGYVGTTDDGLTYAPRPVAEFHDEACDLSPQAPTQALAAGHLGIPGIDIEVPVRASTNLSFLPDAPEVVRYEDSALVGADEGTTVIAGHVDYPGGKLSPFGQLHTMSACDHIYVTDDEGQVHEYVLTEMYTVPQEEIEETGIYTLTGPPALVLVTCSGPTVSDTADAAGAAGLPTYSHNMVSVGVPVEVAV